MAVRVLGALAQDDIKRILSFQIVSQIGYMVMGLGLFTSAGLAGAIFSVAHEIVVLSALFLAAGIVEHLTGTAALSKLAGVAHRGPAIALLFAVPAASLAGIPPLSGFVAKLLLLQAGLAADRGVIVTMRLAVALLTILSMAKIWSDVFWGDPRRAAEPSAEPAVAVPAGGSQLRPGGLMIAGTAALVAVTLGMSADAGPLYGLTLRAANDLIDPGAYLRALGQ